MRPSAVTAASFPPSGLKASAVTAAPASEARSTPSSPNSPRPFLAVAARPPPRRGGDGGGVTAATRLPNREIRPPAPAAARQTAPGEGKVATGRHLTHRTDLLPPPAMAGEMAGDRPRHGLRRDNGSHSITSPLVRPTTASSSGPPPPADQCMSWHVTASCSCTWSEGDGCEPSWSKKTSVSSTWYTRKPASVGALPMMLGPGCAGHHEKDGPDALQAGRATGSRSELS
mmetsp:Transcript_8549/g.27530  ORF Transcript_8549/g.27530 Transcript_8549/m.27530 type:complete len:229 (+) Transcript_8549:225-911(+)